MCPLRPVPPSLPRTSRPEYRRSDTTSCNVGYVCVLLVVRVHLSRFCTAGNGCTRLGIDEEVVYTNETCRARGTSREDRENGVTDTRWGC